MPKNITSEKIEGVPFIPLLSTAVVTNHISHRTAASASYIVLPYLSVSPTITIRFKSGDLGAHKPLIINHWPHIPSGTVTEKFVTWAKALSCTK